MPIPRAADLFGDAQSAVEIAERFDMYKAALTLSAQCPIPSPGAPTLGGPTSQAALLQKALSSAEISKSLSPDVLASIQGQLAEASLFKDLNVAGPGSTGGLVAYDLEAPAKLLAPRPTPLRNKIARRQGIGTAHQFKVISGFTGTGTGGVGLVRPGITESTTNTFGAHQDLRGPKISYGGYQASVPYIQFGVSDQVSWAAQFSGQGYEDIRQLSQTSVLYASMLLEERELLGGRGTAGSFAGALAAPSAVTNAAIVTSPIAGTVGMSGIVSGTIYVMATSECVWGESVPTASHSVTIANGDTVVVTAAPGAGATGTRFYVGTGASAPGSNAGYFYAGRSSNGMFTVQGAVPTTGSNPPVADNSATATEYDGILTYCLGPSSGYVNNIGGVANGTNPVGSLNSANPSAELQTVFAALYDTVKADPGEILANGHDRKQLSDLLKTASSTGYRINLVNATDAHEASLGTMVTSVQNEVTGSMVDLTVHPWAPQGTMPVISWTLPLPDSQISEVFAVYNVQDYVQIEWPVTQFAYETSSYWYGTFVCYAPAWCGAVTGITQI
jgi:hypothetical protein